MPQVPRLTNTAVAPQRLQLPQQQLVPDTGLQSIGEGLTNVAQIRMEEQQKADRAAVVDADHQLGSFENSMLFDPQQGAFTRRGKTAFGLPQQVLPAYDKRASEIEQGLTSNRQKRIFREAVAERRLRIERDLNRHEYQERESYYDETDKAALATSIQSAASYVGRPDRVEQELSRQRAVIDGMAARKGWDDQQKSRYLIEAESKTHESIVGRLLLENKFEAAGRYLAEKSSRMPDAAVESLQRRVILEEEQAFARAERAERRAAEGIIKEGDKLLSEGKLTSAWLERNRRVLPHEEYRHFLRKMKGDGDEGSGPADPFLYSDLRERSGLGQDVRQEAREALLAGRIRSGDYDRILGEVEGQRPGWYKRGTQYISTSAAVSDLNPDPAAAQRKAQMLDDWDAWVKSNPKATDTEAQTEYRRIVDEYAIIDTSKLTLTKRAPRFLVGTRMQPDLDATEAETVRAFEAGEIDEAEFTRQAALLQEWRRSMRAQPAKPAKKTP